MKSLRVCRQYSISDDYLPLHPDFYEFIQKDELSGKLFLQIGEERFEVVIYKENQESLNG